MSRWDLLAAITAAVLTLLVVVHGLRGYRVTLLAFILLLVLTGWVVLSPWPLEQVQ